MPQERVRTYQRRDPRTGRKVNVSQHTRKGRRGPSYSGGGRMMQKGFRARKKHGGLVATAIVTAGVAVTLLALGLDVAAVVCAAIGGLLVLVSVLRFGSPK